jgi:hypothetical protein
VKEIIAKVQDQAKTDNKKNKALAQSGSHGSEEIHCDADDVMLVPPSDGATSEEHEDTQKPEDTDEHESDESKPSPPPKPKRRRPKGSGKRTQQS